MLKCELSIAVLAATLAMACGGQNQQGRSRVAAGDDSNGAASSNRDLIRDLEATVLEGYMQLTLGNIEAYADGPVDAWKERARISSDGGETWSQ